ncbi:DNA polymerase III, delta subunit [Corynebacterium mustelae]|uniref:DNA-directed DNA polymerase n=1 Tax=Corynebacterium mustelae TaxID=571915 RepID=A0A0G3H1V5_9CORY|nr:DNA polymerase III subunit delta [Corynebacterium mustelae]AKK06715.1 DNA polymerase III, delta subunit [Corynebacterium mustelae]
MPNPQVHLIVGDEEFLAERARLEVVASLREQSPEGENLVVTTVRAGDVTEAEIIDMCSPSLFGEDRIIVLNKMEEAGKEPAELVLKFAVDPGPGIYLIIVHSGGGRTKSMVPKLKKIAEVHEVPKLKASAKTSWVTAEFRRHGVRPTPDVVHALLEGVGSDLRELASAVSQLVADTQGEITEAKVREYYAGVAEVSGFDIADLACSGNSRRAIASMRRALQLGLEPAALAAALSMKVSAIARLYSLRGRVDKSLAGKLGMHPFVLEKTAQLARRWSGDAVSEAVIVIAELDASVKGQGGDPKFALENAVLKIAKLAG